MHQLDLQRAAELIDLVEHADRVLAGVLGTGRADRVDGAGLAELVERLRDAVDEDADRADERDHPAA